MNSLVRSTLMTLALAILVIGAKPVETLPPGAAKPGLPDDARASIHDLDARIKALRAEYHAQLDPLEAQIKSVRRSSIRSSSRSPISAGS